MAAGIVCCRTGPLRAERPLRGAYTGQGERSSLGPPVGRVDLASDDSFYLQHLGGGKEVGVAPDAPLAVGATAEGGEDVAGVFADVAAFVGGEGDFEEVPADGEISADGDLLDVGTDFKVAISIMARN
jgi:hypothetical protein